VWERQYVWERKVCVGERDSVFDLRGKLHSIDFRDNPLNLEQGAVIAVCCREREREREIERTPSRSSKAPSSRCVFFFVIALQPKVE